MFAPGCWDLPCSPCCTIARCCEAWPCALERCPVGCCKDWRCWEDWRCDTVSTTTTSVYDGDNLLEHTCTLGSTFLGIVFFALIAQEKVLRLMTKNGEFNEIGILWVVISSAFAGCPSIAFPETTCKGVVSCKGCVSIDRALGHKRKTRERGATTYLKRNRVSLVQSFPNYRTWKLRTNENS